MFEDDSRNECQREIDELRNHLAEVPDDASALHRLGALMHAGEHFDEALALYGRALALEPVAGAAELWSDMGRLHERFGNLREAERCFRRAVAEDPTCPLWHHNLGVLLAKIGDEHEGFESLRDAVMCDSDFVESYLEMGNLLVKRGELKRARRAYSEAVSRAPHNAVAISNLGHLLLLSSQVAEAIMLLERAVQINPSYAHGRVNLGNAYRAAGRVIDAEGQYREVLRLDSANHIAQYNLGLVLLEADDQNGALQAFRDAVAASPSFAEGHMAHASLAEEMGNVVEAVRAYKLFLEYAAANDGRRRDVIEYLIEND